jgi:glycosyltransferase involved in cell wall biosynthesis
MTRVTPKRLISLELINPSLATPDGRARLREKLDRDFPWLLEDRWQVEYWGIRTDGVRSIQGDQIVSVGPRLPRLELPRPAVIGLAWASHFFLAVARPPSGVVLSPAPYSAVGLSLAGIVRRFRAPLMVRISGATGSRALKVRRSRLRFRFLRTIEALVLRRADLVIPMGPFTEHLALRAGVDPDRILDVPFPTSWRGQVARPRVESDPLRVVCAARLVPEKGIDVLLRAWRGVLAEASDAHLEIAGDGPLRASLERLAGELGIDNSVRFSGWLSGEEMSRFFLGASITVLPSRLAEGLGMALVEGGLAGCALIGSDLGGIRDVIESEESGLVVPPEDVAALEAAIVRCLRDPALARRLGDRARVRAEQYLARRETQLRRLRVMLETLRGNVASAGSWDNNQ